MVESSLGRGDRGCGIGRVKVGDVPSVVEINREQGVGLDVPQKIRAEHHSVTDFALDAEIHLYRAWADIVGIEQSLAIVVYVYVRACLQKVADVTSIGVSQAERRVGFERISRMPRW